MFFFCCCWGYLCCGLLFFGRLFFFLDRSWWWCELWLCLGYFLWMRCGGVVWWMGMMRVNGRRFLCIGWWLGIGKRVLCIVFGCWRWVLVWISCKGLYERLKLSGCNVLWFLEILMGILYWSVLVYVVFFFLNCMGWYCGRIMGEVLICLKYEDWFVCSFIRYFWY